jgi:protein phosphatase PTC1
MSEESDGKIHSGCTAVTAFLRIEDDSKQQPFLDIESLISGIESPMSESGEDSPGRAASGSDSAGEGEAKVAGMKETKIKSRNGSRIKKALKSLSGHSLSGRTTPRSSSPVAAAAGTSASVLSQSQSQIQGNGVPVLIPPSSYRRVLYSANAGDARGVLCRAGKAIRLTYDHKGSDKQEAKRIMDAGGFVMSGRVNGVLAVTRSLGDSSMKEFVVGSPYTTETELVEEDEFLILACDGVSGSFFGGRMID